MRAIHVNEDIRLESGFEEFVIDSERDLGLSISGEGSCQAFFRILRAKSLRIRGFAARESDISLVFWNESQAKLCADENYEVMENGHLVVAYGECGGGDTDRSSYVALRQRHAHAEILSASLVNEKKNYRMNVVNFAPKTLGEIRNFAVVREQGKLMIDAIGKIVKGAKGAKSHQTSRALSFAAGQSSEILPELLIDENDVEASHAMSIGRVDDEQLYYLMSRGLTMQQCTALISTGYLMPVTEVLANEELRTALQKELERKIEAL
jgi:Fe-S cluster assembly protein SufD